MIASEPTTLSYLARRGVSGQWRGFLRALVETLDAHLDAASRDDLLRAVGARLGALSPLPACASLAELEARMNDSLAQMEWGYAEIAFDPADRAIIISHAAPPVIATEVDPSGGWIVAVLEGLFGAWLSAQPGAEPSLAPHRVSATGAQVRLRYGRGG